MLLRTHRRKRNLRRGSAPGGQIERHSGECRGEIILTLTRHIGESFVIDDYTIVTVLHVNGNQVRSGIDAPEDVLILREGLRDKESPAVA